MNCSKCGTDLRDDAVICTLCGANVKQASPSPSAEAAEPKKLGKMHLIALLAELALIVLGVAIFLGNQGLLGLSGESTPIEPDRVVITEDEVLVSGGATDPVMIDDESSPGEPYMVVTNEDEVLIYRGATEDQALNSSGASDPVKIAGNSVEESVSFDGMTVGFGMDRVDPYHFSLVVYDGKDILEVEEDVSFFKICDNGSKVIYLVDENTNDFTATLCSYDVASRKTEELAEGVFDRIKPVVSPDGKSISYSTLLAADDNGTSESYRVYLIKDGGEAEVLGENVYPFAVSDKAEYIYYAKNDGVRTLYVSKNGNEVNLGKLAGEVSYFFNRDYSELLFTSDYETYMSIGGAEAEKISSRSLVSIVPPNQTNIAYDFASSFGQRIDVASLKDHVVTMASDTGFFVAYMNSSYEFSEIASIESEEYITVTYCLHKYCDGVLVSKDDTSLYFTNEKGDLFLYSNYRDLKDEPVKIAEDVDSLYLNFDESLLYFISAAQSRDLGIFVGTLNVMENKAGATSTEIDEGVFRVKTSSFGDVYYVFEIHVYDNGTEYAICEAFYSRDGKTFESIADEAIYRY